MRLFVAVWPPEPVVGALSALARPPVPGVRWTTPAQWHVTLRFYGEVPDDAVPSSSLDRVAWPLPVEARLGPATACFGRSVLLVPVAGLEVLAEAVADAGEDRPFSGHITLARSRSGGDLRRLAGVPVAGEWTVDEVTLVRSRTLPDGARYDVLARYPPSNTRSQLR